MHIFDHLQFVAERTFLTQSFSGHCSKMLHDSPLKFLHLLHNYQNYIQTPEKLAHTASTIFSSKLKFNVAERTLFDHFF